MKTPSPTAPPIPARLGLWDTTSIIVGIIIGVGIFETPSDIFFNAGGPWQAMLLWVVAGLLSLVGALCYAELASTYPRSGGEYVYLTRAYGSWAGFLFAWGQLAVIRTGGGIAALAFIFAYYAGSLWGLNDTGMILAAVLVIAVLSLLNILGVSLGKNTQNVLTVAKVVGLAGIVLAGFLWADPDAEVVAKARDHPPSLAMALILVFYTFDGWNEAACVTAEVQGKRRNLPRALILGTVAVTVIYLLVNAAFLVALGFDGASTAAELPAAVLQLPLGAFGARAMNLLVIVSVLGGINGTIFTSARVFAELGADHPLFAPLSRWDPRWGTPARSLLLQGVLGAGMVVGVALTTDGRVGQFVQGVLSPDLTADGSLASHIRDGFDALVVWTAPVFWLFFLMSAASVMILRRKDRGIERPFPVPAYPLLPLIFCAWCGYMLYAAIDYAVQNEDAVALVGLVLFLFGIPLYLLSRCWGASLPRPIKGPLAPVSQEKAVEVGGPSGV
jgi:amino acid transporter